MRKIFLYFIPVLFFVSCQKNQKEEPLADEKKAATETSETAPLTAEEISNPSEIYLSLTKILDKATEKMEVAKTTDEVVAVATQYYDEYWTLATEKYEEWSTQLTENEKKNYSLRDKEFVKLIREKYIEVGGTKEELRKLLHDLMIKCMQYDTALKAKLDTVQVLQ